MTAEMQKNPRDTSVKPWIDLSKERGMATIAYSGIF